MKFKATSLFLGLCLAISVVAVSPAQAQSKMYTTAFSSFHVRCLEACSGPWTGNPYDCLTESEGAVINQCKYLVRVAFDMPC